MLIREPREGLIEEGTPWLRRKDEQGLKKRGGKVQGQVQGTTNRRQKQCWRSRLGGLNGTDSQGHVDFNLWAIGGP